MNNFTAFILGALLAVVLVGYVFFGSGSKEDKVSMPLPATSVDSQAASEAQMPAGDKVQSDEAKNVSDDKAVQPSEDAAKADDTKAVETTSDADVKSDPTQPVSAEEKTVEAPVTADDSVQSDVNTSTDQSKVEDSK